MMPVHLLRPEWLWAWLPLWWLVWRLAKPAPGASGWRRVCDAHLLPHILQQTRPGGLRRFAWWVAAAGTLLILAMAGPVWQRHPQPVFQTQSALVLILDLSRSMDAIDLKPSRLVRAKHKMVDLLRKRREGQTALLVFAGEAFVVTPLTHDTATITAQLASLDTGLMPVQGSRPDRAIKKALELLQQGGIAHGHLLLMTDGWSGDEQMASRVSREGHLLTILGVGTPEGAPIPLLDGGFLNDAHGAIVMAKLDNNPLRKVALLGGGLYQAIRADDGDIDALLAVQPSNRSGGIEKTDMLSDDWQEEGPWLVLVVLPMVALVFRRGWLLLLLVWMPGTSQAVEWDTLWRRPDQQAMQQWEAGQMEEAARRFDNREWQGAAHYRAGQLEQAVAAWQESSSTTALYNKGTGLARLGRLPEAAQAFAEVLQRQPDHADAQHNLAMVRKAMQPSEQSKEQPGPSGRSQPPGQQPPGQQQSGQQQSGQQQSGQQQSGQQQSGQQSPGQQSSSQQSSAQQPSGRQTVDQPATGQPHALGVRRNDQSPSGREPGGHGADDPSVPEAQQGHPAIRAQSEPVVPGGQGEQSQESQVAMEQWLRRVPDDPGGLLRRKFRYQYQRDGAQGRAEEGAERW
ncbi:MAG: VWA domain-containing protein [Magnetococcus sp. DMHC-8]